MQKEQKTFAAFCSFHTLAPLKGELSAQLTEGSRLGQWPSLAPQAQIPGFLDIRASIPPPAEAFLKKSRTPQTRLSPGQLRSALRVRKPRAATASIPSRGAKGLYEFALGFSASVLRTDVFYGAIATGNRLFGIRCAEHRPSSAALFGRHLPRRGSFRTHRCGGPPSPVGKV